MRSPCLTCELRDQPKDNGVCEACPSRIAYIAWIEGAEHMIPTIKEEQIKPPVNLPGPTPKPVENIRKCRECGKIGLVGEVFSKSRHGYFHICKECQGAKIKAGHASRRKPAAKFGEKTRFPRKSDKKQPPAEKTCKLCGATGPVGDLFSININSRDGYYHMCKSCQAASVRGKGKAQQDDGSMDVYLPDYLRDKLNTMAAAQLRTPANMIMWMIKTYEERGRQ